MKMIDHLKTLECDDFSHVITALIMQAKYPDIVNIMELISLPEYDQIKADVIESLNKEITFK